MARTYEQLQKSGDEIQKLGAAVQLWEQVIEQYQEIDIRLLGFSVRLPETWEDDAFITVRADRGGERIVAFMGGDTVGSAIRKVVNKLRAGKLEFKEDRFEKRND